ncbi:zinc finger protein OZF-like [Toxorhynchites rutilus septentrionalis]|uniref:zinc finger protein OZF-like n=1 Tax=Toxorhynchites rutilus septentrionalis TaxID=329112 RepID=UPI002479AB33|nr:zinc finger protein OZF-like [Toxorhynchites rutilus septentrionalis]
MSLPVGGTSSCSSICRICMENSNNLVSVFAKLENVFIAQIITECTSVQITENDGLPESICKPCMTELKRFQEFIGKAHKTDRALRRLFKSEIKLGGSEQNPDQKLESEYQFAMVLASKSTVAEAQESDSDLNDDDDANESDWLGQDSDGGTNFSRVEKQPKDTAVETESMDESELETFKTVELDLKMLLCCSCFAQFENEEQLNVHSKEAHGNRIHIKAIKKYTCNLCLRGYSSAISLRAHNRKMETVNKVYECKICGLRVLEQQKKRQHAQSHVKKGQPKHDKHQQSVEELIQQHGRLCCALGCLEAFETDEQLLVHAHSVHKANKVEATLAYNEGKPVECPICFKRFKDDECLKRHLLFKYKPSKNICTLCGARFPSLSSLTIHERSHTKEKPFECEICSKGFGDKQSLKRHHVKHTNEKPFMCSICGVSFKRKRAMQSHMIIHEPGQLPFKCEICDKRFRVKAKMLYHMRTHTGEKPYPCRYCDKSFADFSNRMRHELSHTGEKPYRCSYCPMGFITRRFLMEHEKIHRRNEVKPSETCFPEIS